MKLRKRCFRGNLNILVCYSSEGRQWQQDYDFSIPLLSATAFRLAIPISVGGRCKKSVQTWYYALTKNDFRCSIMTRRDDCAVMFVIERCRAKVNESNIRWSDSSEISLLNNNKQKRSPINKFCSLITEMTSSVSHQIARKTKIRWNVIYQSQCKTIDK